jgi:hypothetical protein
VTPDELVGLLEDMRDRAIAAAEPCALEMARVYSVHLSRVTLRRAVAAPGQFGTPAPPGSPPAFRTGLLSESVTHWPGGSSGMTGWAYAGPHAIYAVTQETGAIHFARRARYMHWVNDAGPWWKKRVDIPPRPYMQPAVAEVVADGSLQRAAALTFRALVGHY